MKIFRPLTYVVAAAAMCILCFSGNGNYIYAMCIPSAGNDIVQQPDDPLAEKTINKEKIQNSRIKRYVQLYVSKCLLQNCSDRDGFEEFEALSDEKFVGVYCSGNDTLHEQILIRLPGNRSP